MSNEHESGDDYVRRISAYIRANEQGLAAAGLQPRRRPAQRKSTMDSAATLLNPLGWFYTDNTLPAPISANVKPVVLSFDEHHLYYLLMRMEAIGLEVGSLDVKIECASRPMNYVSIPGVDKSDALSLRSFTSTLSAVSKLSLGGGWWGKSAPATVDEDLKYVFSCFTKLPAISLHAPGPRLIAELAADPIVHAVPFDSLKMLNTLTCEDVDPRTLLGWDRLAESLRSLTVKRSGLEDVGDIFIGSVIGDQARREGVPVTSKPKRPMIPPSRRGSFYTTPLPASVPEDSEDIPPTPTLENPSSTDVSSEPTPTLATEPNPEMPAQNPGLSNLKWVFLRHLSLAENALTFIPSSPFPHLTSLTHLDLSSNLLVSVPPALSSLYNLVSLNLSDNMIDSVLGIYTIIGSINQLSLSKNRLESICGLERLMGLERVDLRQNLVEESAEVGRLATLPNVKEVFVEGNPLVELEEGYRIRIFDLFWREGKSIILDGAAPGWNEKRYLTAPPPEQMTSSRTPSTIATSPPAVPIGGTSPLAGPSKSPGISPAGSAPESNTASPQLAAVAVARGRKKKGKRIVDLDGNGASESGSSGGALHQRGPSDATLGGPLRNPSPVKTSSLGVVAKVSEPEKTLTPLDISKPQPPKLKPIANPNKAAFAPANLSSTSTSPRPKLAARHSRHMTEFSPRSPPSPSSSFSSNQGTITAAAISSSPPNNDRPSVAHRRSATMSSSAKRRARVSGSMYEPPTPGENGASESFSEAEAFRARIEALRKDMGEGWLKVFNQSHIGSPTPGGSSTSPGIASG